MPRGEDTVLPLSPSEPLCSQFSFRRLCSLVTIARSWPGQR
jgi:hypothetical protein